MREASPLYKKLSEDEKAGYVKLAEGNGSPSSHGTLRSKSFKARSPCAAASWSI